MTRPLVFSMRREMWEHRSVVLAPLAVGALALVAGLVSILHSLRRSPDELDELYSGVGFVVLATSFVVAIFYCLDALHGERRDRSILFWKSLPVSDLTTVVAKASIPFVVLPATTFAIIVAEQLVLRLLHTAILALAGHGADIAALWIHVPVVPMALELLYGLTVIVLWHAPLYAWLLLVSCWARRAPLLWALLPPLAVVLVEKAVRGTLVVGEFLQHRLVGMCAEAFTDPPAGVAAGRLDSLDPGKYLASPGMWIGLVVAALFLATAVWLRRHRQPI